MNNQNELKDSIKKDRKRIGYLLNIYPRFSETFIVNEILELERQGVEIVIFSLNPPEGGRFHSQIGQVKAPVIYLPEQDTRELWLLLKKHHRELKGFHWNIKSALELGLTYDPNAKGQVYLLQVLNLVYLLKKYNIQHLHAHFASTAAFVALSAHLISGIPYSFTAHAYDIYRDTTNQNLLAKKIEYAKFVVTVSDYNKNYLSQLFNGRFDDKIVRIYNGVDLKLFSGDGTGRQPNLILSVGRLIPKKGLEYLIQACQILKAQGIDFNCQVVGEGEYEHPLRQMVKERGVEDKVRFRGPKTQTEVIKLMKKATLLCLPSVIAEDGNRDSLPTVLLEALALGLPAVSTKVAGIPEIIDNGKDGILVEQKDPQALSQALSTLLENSELRANFSQNGLQKIRGKFAIENNVSVLRTAFGFEEVKIETSPAHVKT